MLDDDLPDELLACPLIPQPATLPTQQRDADQLDDAAAVAGAR